jgi:hypothetical protein
MPAVVDTAAPFAELAPWQALVARNREALSSLEPGAAIGLLSDGGEPGPVSQLRGEMLVWSASAAGMQVVKRPFAGFQDAGVDLLLVLSETALGNLLARIDGNPFPKLSQDSARGDLSIYYLKARADLEDLGYEGFFDTVGLSFAGACR